MTTEMPSPQFEDAQVHREKYIRELDQRTDKTDFAKTNADSLYSLGLTMYSQNFSFDSLVYNAFASSALDNKVALHPEQRRVLQLIEKNRGLIFSAPTSFGKTFVVFEYICRARPQNVVMVVPTLALIDEYKQKIIKQYRDKFDDYNIYLSIDPEKQYDFSQRNIFIVTHDRVIDENTVAIFDSIDFLVIDEVYKLQKDSTNERVLILNIAYYNMVRLSKKYVLLAPFISGVEHLEKLDDIPAFYATNYSPVVNDVKTYDILSEDERVLYTDKILQTIPAKDNTLIYFPTVVEIDSFIENDFKLDTFIINRLTYKYRQSVRDVVDATLASYPTTKVSKVINKTIRFKSSYVEFEFYSKVDLIRYFMRCDNESSVLINTLYDRLMKNIEMLYYLNSPSKKMLKDLGIYEGDIDAIISIIGNDFTSIADLQQLLSVHAYKLTNISVVSQYVISRLIS